MTIYELTQAIVRYKRAVFISLGVILILVLAMMFTFEDGGIGWRGGLKYESGFEISVVTPGTKSLSEKEPTANLAATAAQYADLLTTGEAAEAIGILSGYTLDETLTANTSTNSSVIRGSVIGPTAELAKAASHNAFVWLSQKIQRPLDAVPTVTTTLPPPEVVSLKGTFPSNLSVEINQELDSVSDDLFVLVDAGDNQTAVAVPIVERAGGSVVAAVSLEAGGSLLLRLETATGELYDTLRLAPAPLPATAAAYPNLVVTLGADSLTRIPGGEDEPPTWEFEPQNISTEWVDGVPASDGASDGDAEVQQIQIALLTEVPTALQIGGRRAPLMGFAVLLIGLIAVLTGVIIADSWRQARDEAAISHRSIPSGRNGTESSISEKETVVVVEPLDDGTGLAESTDSSPSNA